MRDRKSCPSLRVGGAELVQRACCVQSLPNSRLRDCVQQRAWFNCWTSDSSSVRTPTGSKFRPDAGNGGSCRTAQQLLRHTQPTWGLCRTAQHRPWKACSFSTPSLSSRSAPHQGARKCSRCGATFRCESTESEWTVSWEVPAVHWRRSLSSCSAPRQGARKCIGGA